MLHRKEIVFEFYFVTYIRTHMRQMWQHEFLICQTCETCQTFVEFVKSAKVIALNNIFFINNK